MKKRLVSLWLALALCLACAVPALAADGVTVSVDGTPVAWTDAEPFIDANGRTMVPFRAVAEALGLTVGWDPDTRTARFTDGTKTIYFPIGSAVAATSEGGTVEMDTEAVIVNGRTYAPVRYLAEYFGYAVAWDDATRTVGVTAASGKTAAEMLAELAKYSKAENIQKTEEWELLIRTLADETCAKVATYAAQYGYTMGEIYNRYYGGYMYEAGETRWDDKEYTPMTNYWVDLIGSKYTIKTNLIDGAWVEDITGWVDGPVIHGAMVNADVYVNGRKTEDNHFVNGTLEQLYEVIRTHAN